MAISVLFFIPVARRTDGRIEKDNLSLQDIQSTYRSESRNVPHVQPASRAPHMI